ncbi:hypothetical protein Mgra_00006569 [Meloidogyne graminicola]|uniref:Uncharacterized protein n=1 Tax=Meloidogyne graminicola TaxID=189291 RepID=A0A8S9ZL73_9BILA|nr:hypothetical protein Mgra_00006569 [Meloidogyne graminicola]
MASSKLNKQIENGVHSEPGSFALEESPIEEEELLFFGKEENKKVNKEEQNLEKQKTLNKRREYYLKGRRQYSEMSSLYKQVNLL